ncbi:MAG: Tellurite resistance protein TerB, partial [Hyphomicrobiaceae bacterium]|nr:Tellurite resistance protein TerB [Hyphomicrobiaceae bacterium]
MTERAAQEALIHVMVTMSAADRTMTDDEMQTIGDLVRRLPVFGGFAPDDLVAVARQTAALLS